MNALITRPKERGMTLIELLVVIVGLAMMVMMSLMLELPEHNQKARACRIQCVNNLKQCGLGFRVWEDDHAGKFPMDLAETNGGTTTFIDGPNLWRRFQVLSNELATPKVLICPADSRWIATNFTFLRNSNISYFIGLNANETNPQLILSGDRNITNGTLIKNGILELTPNQPAGWTAEMHNKVGNIALADGSVQQVSINGLRAAVANTGLVTNRLQMPW